MPGRHSGNPESVTNGVNAEVILNDRGRRRTRYRGQLVRGRGTTGSNLPMRRAPGGRAGLPKSCWRGNLGAKPSTSAPKLDIRGE